MNHYCEKEEYHIRIIKYLNYQKFKIDNDLLHNIQNIQTFLQSKNPELEDLNISTHQYVQIKNLILIFQDIPLEQNKQNKELYLFYIFILLNLPKYMVKNLSRSYLTQLYLNYQVKSKYNYMEIISRNNYLNDLISILQDVKIINPENINLFIETIHNFFT